MKLEALLQAHVDDGRQLREEMTMVLNEAFNVTPKKVSFNPHYIIRSTIGAGKTFTTQRFIEDNNVKAVWAKNLASMVHLVVRIADFVHLRDEKYMVLDDCDALFRNEEALLLLKNIVDPDVNEVIYPRSIDRTAAMLCESPDPKEQRIGELLRDLRRGDVELMQNRSQLKDGVNKNGLRFSMDNKSLIFLTNKKLIAPSSTAIGNNSKLTLEAQVRDRVNYYDFDRTPETMWGLTAALIIDDLQTLKPHKLTNEQKQELLRFTWDTWKKLSSFSARRVIRLAEKVINHPDDYRAYWDAEVTVEEN